VLSSSEVECSDSSCSRFRTNSITVVNVLVNNIRSHGPPPLGHAAVLSGSIPPSLITSATDETAIDETGGGAEPLLILLPCLSGSLGLAGQDKSDWVRLEGGAAQVPQAYT
jgi:hypothetical protein